MERPTSHSKSTTPTFRVPIPIPLHKLTYQGGGIKTEGNPDDSAQDATAFNNIHDNQVVGTVNYGIRVHRRAR